MTKLEMLFVRACKSNSTHFRLQALHKKFYYQEYDHKYIINILSNICDEYFPITLNKFIAELTGQCFLPENQTTEEKMLRILINKIRFIENKDMPKDFILPIMWRKYHETI